MSYGFLLNSIFCFAYLLCSLTSSSIITAFHIGGCFIHGCICRTTYQKSKILSHVVLTYLVRSRIRCISLSPMLMPIKAVIVQSYNISCAKFDYSVTSLYTVLPFATFGNFDVSAMLLLSYRLHYLIYSVLCFFQARLWTFFKFFSTLVFRSLSYCFITYTMFWFFQAHFWTFFEYNIIWLLFWIILRFVFPIREVNFNSNN